jgi:hypothetical protein
MEQGTAWFPYPVFFLTNQQLNVGVSKLQLKYAFQSTHICHFNVSLISFPSV